MSAVLVLLMVSPACVFASHYHESVLGAVGAGNYTYYMLTNPGSVILYLSTIEGDADLYVSSKNLKPTYDVDNHELQSTTCGIEQIKVPSHFDRPLSIAVYGHPSHDVSFYELQIDVFDPPEESNLPLDSYDISEGTDFDPDSKRHAKSHSSGKTAQSPNFPDNKQSEEQSILWTLFLRILQVLLDLLVD